MNVDNFIKNHNYINYCEALLFSNGEIEYAIPSHIESLISVTNLTRQQVAELMPIEAGPVQWLVDYTNCVSLWYDFCYLPENITTEQNNVIQKLVDNGILSKQYIGYISKEKAITERNQIYRDTGKWTDIERETKYWYKKGL